MKSLTQKLSYLSWRANGSLVSQRRCKGDQIVKGYDRLKKWQEKFQVDDGTPIHLKRGITDKALFYITFALSGIGVLCSFKFYYSMIFPSKQEDSEED